MPYFLQGKSQFWRMNSENIFKKYQSSSDKKNENYYQLFFVKKKQ